MIGQARERLHDWIRDIVPAAAVVNTRSEFDEQAPVALWAHLLSASPKAPLRNSRGTAPLQLQLRFLIYPLRVESAEQAIQDSALSDLFFSALQHPDFEVEENALEPTVWLALKAEPTAAIVLSMQVRKQRPERSAPPVHKIVVRSQLGASQIEPVDTKARGERS